MLTNSGIAGIGQLAWVDLLLLGWFALVAISVAYVAWDVWRNTPEATVVKWAWTLVTVYFGPVAAAIYIFTDKEPKPGTHEEYVAPLWRQGAGSTLHCVAGDATGIVVAAVITATLGLPMGIDLISEYALGFLFGWLVFQALFMRSMYNGSYRRALRATLLPEWLSMNMVMAGMIPVMVIGMMGRDMRAMEPASFLFWGVMSFGISVGFLTSLPVNIWMVAVGLKHGLATERKTKEQRAEREAALRQAAGTEGA